MRNTVKFGKRQLVGFLNFIICFDSRLLGKHFRCLFTGSGILIPSKLWYPPISLCCNSLLKIIKRTSELCIIPDIVQALDVRRGSSSAFHTRFECPHKWWCFWHVFQRWQTRISTTTPAKLNFCVFLSGPPLKLLHSTSYKPRSFSFTSFPILLFTVHIIIRQYIFWDIDRVAE